MTHHGAFALAGLAVLGLTGCDKVPGTMEWSMQRDVSRLLIDPSSARFEVVLKTDDKVCGMVNGKNRMGGYAGSTPFIWSRVLGPEIYDEPSTSDVQMMRYDTPSNLEHSMRIATGCDFAAEWIKTCGQPIKIDEEMCRLWKAGDMRALERYAGNY